MSCNHFCPYSEECPHTTNILSTAKPKLHTMERIPNYSEVFHPIDDVVADVRRCIEEAVSAPGIGWHIIKAQPAIGKTEIYLDIAASDMSKRFLIAAPTNILKRSIYNRAVRKNIPVMVTPSLEEIKDEVPRKIWEHITYLYKSGTPHLVHPFINEVLMKKNIPCLRRYMKELQAIENFDGTVVTTHRKLMNYSKEVLDKFDAVIIDEDIIFKSVISNQGEIPVSVLKKLKSSGSCVKLSNKIRKVLFKSRTDEYFELPGFEWDDVDTEKDEENGEDTPTPVDVPSFCRATHFCYRKASDKHNKINEDTIAFIKTVEFKDIKYILVSATADKTVYDYFFKGNVIFYECKKAENKGSLNQYHAYSMSRSYIDNHPDVFDRIRKLTGNKNMLTHKKYKGKHYFGNAEGINDYEGQNIDVVGTPYHAEFLYKLFAFSIGLDFDTSATMKSCNATHNGYRFRFTTYDDEALRAIHFWMVESELEQAVGRARLLRHGCVVNLFSNFPLSQGKMIDTAY
jgi:hypothetical protein